MFGFAETLTIGPHLPTNTTEAYKLNVGPILKDLKNIKEPVLNWLINQLGNWKTK